MYNDQDSQDFDFEQEQEDNLCEQPSPSGFKPYQPLESSYARPSAYNPQEPETYTPVADQPSLSDSYVEEYLPINTVQIAGESEHKKGILKTIIIIVLVVLVLGIAGGIALMIHGARSADTSANSTSMEQDNLDNALSQQASSLAELPDLASLFGLSLENAFAELDGEYGVVSKAAGSSTDFKPDCTTVVTLVRLEEPFEVADTSSDSAEKTEESATSSEESKDTAASKEEEAVKTISVDTAVSDDAEQPHIKLLLDSHDMVVGAVLTLDMSSIKFPSCSFADLTASKSFVKEVLKAVGLAWPESYQYVAPSTKDYTTYKEGSSTDVTLESYTFEGSTDLETSPEKWQIKLSYDYGTAGSQNADALSSVKRTLVISLA